MRLSDLDGRRVGIWGFGREGRAALHALAGRPGAGPVRVFVPEADAGIEPADRELAEFAHGDDAVAALADREVVVRSPGVSIYRPEIAELADRGVALTTGTALWFAEVEGSVPVLAVTGTKGKSTTASLAAHLARAAGVDTGVGGNVGRPLIALAAEPRPELYVAELSSYQLADLESRPTVAVILNLYREHLDWHLTEERYFADKLRVLEGPDPPVAVLNALDARLAERGTPRTRWFGDRRGVHLDGDEIVNAGGRVLASRADLPLPGEHNTLNACAAVEALDAIGVEAGDAPAALRSFRGLPHRLERVAETDGRLWIDDSISTAPESAVAALRSFSERPVTLIAGGFDRGQDYAGLAAELARREAGAAVVALPETGGRLVAALDGRTPAHPAGDLAEAVAVADRVTPAGGVVLLSPAAPSYGAYRDFEERGEHFVRLVAGYV